jgi:hypothetical protein
MNLKKCRTDKKNHTKVIILGTIFLSAVAVFLFNVGMTGAETVGSDVFKIVLTIIGADRAESGDVVAIVTVNDHSKVKFFELKSTSNTSDSSHQTADDRIIEYVATFPNVTVNS